MGADPTNDTITVTDDLTGKTVTIRRADFAKTVTPWFDGLDSDPLTRRYIRDAQDSLLAGNPIGSYATELSITVTYGQDPR